MSNPTDPRRPSPEQPDPKKPDPNKPDGAAGDEPGETLGNRSSFEFALPEGVGSFSELPPVPQPDPNDSQTNHAAIPPRPEATRPASNTFDFIDLPEVPLSGVGLDAKPLGPPAAPSDSSISLPAVPTLPGAAGDSSVLFAPGGPASDPPSGMMGSSVLDLAALPEVPPPGSASSISVPDISSVFPAAPDIPATDPASFIGPQSSVELELPTADPASAVDLPGSGSASGLGGGLSELELPPAEPVSSVMDSATLSQAPGSDDSAGSFVLPGPLSHATTTPTPDLDAVMGELESPTAVDPASGWTEQSEAGGEKAADTGETEFVTTRSSFEFALPEGVGSFSELPPVPQPDPNDSQTNHAAIPPRPEATRPASNTFDFIDLPDAPASGSGLQKVAATPTPLEPIEPIMPPTEKVFDLPKVPTAGDAEDAVTGSMAPSGPVDPVAPASGWLDGEALPVQPVEPESRPFESAPAEPVESSDIFTGSRATIALPAEQSDVLAATAEGGALPAEPVRPSDVALTFDAPPGGSTMHDAGASDLPVADEVPDSSTMLGDPVTDPESIHDMPGMALQDPLFDSSRLAGAPELPSKSRQDDALDYGRSPDAGGDASSILADLSDSDVHPSGADSSSVRVESPDVGRTLNASPAEGGFDLTVPDEPIPADLFGEPAEPPPTEATEWQTQSGSDLFADRPATPEFDLAEASSSPPDPESLSTNPSSIFAGSPSAISAGAAKGAPEVPEAEPAEAEFANEPEPPAPRRTPAAFSPPGEATPSAAARGIDDSDSADLAETNPNRGVPEDASLSTILRGHAEDASEVPTKNASPLGNAPEVSVDWMAGSGEGAAISEPPKVEAESDRRQKSAKPEKARSAKATIGATGKTRPTPAPAAEEDEPRAEVERAGEKERRAPGKKGGGMLVGMLAGALLAGGAWAGLYFGNVIPNSEKSTAVTPKGGGDTPPGGDKTQPNPQPATSDANTAFAAGDISQALKLVKEKAATSSDEKALAGRVRVYANVQGVGDAEDLKQGREQLRQVMDDPDKSPEGVKRGVHAAVALGASFEAAGNKEEARKVFTEAKAKFPTHAAVFDALLDRLDAPPADAGTSFRAPRLTPAEAERVLLAFTVLLQDEQPKTEPKGDDPEPGLYYWKAVKLAGEGKYDEAVKLIGQAKAAHVKRAKALAGRGINPLTDPLEQMFPRACDEMAAYWKMRAELYKNPGIAAAIKKDGLGNTLNSLAKAQAEIDNAKAELKTANANLKTASDNLKTAMGEAKKAADEAKLANDKLKTATADLKLANDKVKLVDKDLTVARTEIAKLDKELKVVGKEKLAAEDGLKAAVRERDAARKEAKDASAALTAVATELKAAVKLPEKWEPADLTAGVKNLASFAKDKDLKNLLDRATKAEVAAKAATDKLATETKKLTDKYDTDTAKLKTDHTAELKKLTDTYATDLKKLKDASVVEMKKAADKFAIDTKKLTDDHLADVKKLKEDHAVALKAEQAKTEAEKKAAALREVTIQKQLANAITPSQGVDIWLPVLTDLRRKSDAEAAITMAKRSLAASPPDSEEAAKARTLTGMAHLVKGEYATARDEFQAAKRSPSYNAEKPWAKVVENGLEATEDPLALYRQPVVIPPVDRATAAKSLDAGIAAYKEGRYEAAVAALTDAAKNDPADPVAWYYLGATRWAMGDEEQAKKDFGQGAEREKAAPRPSRVISAALAPIQGRIRDAIDRARP